MKRILVVEDHKDSCLWITAVLRQCGFAALEAGDGAVAVRMAHSERPDLILLDWHLPAGGGAFVMENLRRGPETARIPIVIMTGDLEVDRERMKADGALEVFSKPMDVHAFLRTIRAALVDPTPPPADAASPLLERQDEGAAGELLPA